MTNLPPEPSPSYRPNRHPDDVWEWQFRRDPDAGGFALKPRRNGELRPAAPGNRPLNDTVPHGNGKQHYRVLGDSPTPAPKPGVRRAMEATHGRPRPNRYNSQIMMVVEDSLDKPDPWDAGYTPPAVSDDPRTYRRLPIQGEVAAGRFEVTVAYHTPGSYSDAEHVLVNSANVKVNRETFALKVRGTSMIDNEIDDGDIILVQPQDWADDGDFVVAWLTDSSDSLGNVTLKRYYGHKHSDRVVLEPANQALSPIHIFPRKGDKAEDLDGLKIQGRVTAIIKTGGWA